jgi:hypothetical protein
LEQISDAQHSKDGWIRYVHSGRVRKGCLGWHNCDGTEKKQNSQAIVFCFFIQIGAGFYDADKPDKRSEDNDACQYEQGVLGQHLNTFGQIGLHHISGVRRWWRLCEKCAAKEQGWKPKEIFHTVVLMVKNLMAQRSG